MPGGDYRVKTIEEIGAIVQATAGRPAPMMQV
jgi:hypothetical protein